MHRGLQLGRQYLDLKGIIGVLGIDSDEETQGIQGLHDTSSHPRLIFIGLTPLTP
jgi:hypothetical protein